MLRSSVSLLFIFLSITCFSQDEEESHAERSASKFHAGLYFGALFPNNNSTDVYDGYGYDIHGVKNAFSTSLMNNNINGYYGGGYGQPDQVAVALGVNHGDWSFDETDMPGDLTYSVGIVLGLQTSYSINDRNLILLNFMGSRLSVSGNFTITLVNTSPVPQQPGTLYYQTFGITGSEQRFMFQLGYQHIFGEEGGFNFFVEGGAIGTLTKYLKNQIAINSLNMDLSSFYNQPLYDDFRLHKLSGIGFGAWGGLGMTTASYAKTTLQLVYNPSLENITLGPDPKPSLQHYIGLRAYYNL
ncbi:MAG: hypothetical protein JJE25_02070 [Bacteroidia bacterium]|nr:hypothetical protein [Bacteroidia bacterium]